eukprot:scaffold8264_cov109-Isochrysis_galbana.AAC.9
MPRWISARVARSEVATGFQSLSAFRSSKLFCEAAYMAYDAWAGQGSPSRAAGPDPRMAPNPNSTLRREEAGAGTLLDGQTGRCVSA